MKTPNQNQPGSVVALYGIGFEWIEWTDNLQKHRPTPCHCSFCNLYQPVYAGLWCRRCRSQNNMLPLIEFGYQGDVLFARINPAYEGRLNDQVSQNRGAKGGRPKKPKQADAPSEPANDQTLATAGAGLPKP